MGAGLGEDNLNVFEKEQEIPLGPGAAIFFFKRLHFVSQVVLSKKTQELISTRHCSRYSH
ncbi:hypothetical protein P7K49_033806, partial [Saguinus oedipus]